MSSWSLQLERKVFDGMEIISPSHVDMKDKVLNLDPRVCCSIVCLYVHRFESFWEFMLHYFIGEAEEVCGASVPGYVATQSGYV